MRLIALFFALVLTTLTTPTTAENKIPVWTFIDTTPTGTKVYARSDDILAGRAEDTAAKVWVRFDAAADSTISWKSSISLYVVNCVAETYRAVQHTQYYRNGQTKTFPAREGTTFITPGSNMESIKKMVCYTPLAATDYR